jgi:hypothetical protein
MGKLFDIPYGGSTLQALLPDRTFELPNTSMPKLAPSPDLEASIHSALDAPLGSPRIRDLVKPNARVTIAFDDPTVPSFGPFRRLAFEAALRELDIAGVPFENVTAICANSLHRKFNAEELAAILGDDLVKQFGARLFCHDAEDATNLVYFGKTPSGYDVEINRHAVESDLTIYIVAAQNRGFSGGWKSVCVGLSTYRSIRHHHTPDGMSMSVKDNRMHRVLNEMAVLFESKSPSIQFKIEAIEAGPFQTAQVFAGNTWKVREAVLEVLDRQFPARRSLSDTPFDVVIYGVPDWSPYAIFASMNPILTLLSSGLGYLGGTLQALGKQGCTCIMVTPCPNEWDDIHHPSYRDVWQNVLPHTRDPYAIEKQFSECYAHHERYIDMYRNGNAFHPIHGIFATQPLRRLSHVGRVIVAGAHDPAVPAHLDFTAAKDVADALARCAEIHGPDFSIAYAQHPAAPTKLAM